ncbi:MAG: DsbA family protein [Gemmatimonadetes bacterium]|nr:DsbA family protein [Gemmatimonadota bacterium]
MSQSRRATDVAARSRYRAFYVVLGVIALAGIAALAWSAARGRTGKASVRPLDLGALADDPRALYEKATPVKAGPDSARVRIVVFSDFTCPYCGRFATEVQPLLMRDFVEPGKVQFIHYDFPLGGEGEHRHSFLAARAGRCAAEQGKFWPFHDRIFGDQAEWAFQPGLPLEHFERDAARVGLDGGRFAECLESDRYVDVVAANRLLGKRLGVRGTPTVIMDQQIIDNPLDYDAFKRRIETALGGAQ